MFSSTGFDLLLLAAGISDPPVGEEVASIVADTPTVANFEEVEFVNKTTNNTFLEGVSMIISSTPIRRSGVITFTDPRQTLPLDLSVSMIENEQPLNLTIHTSDVPLDLAMPKSNTPKNLATEKTTNLCGDTRTESKLNHIISSVHSSRDSSRICRISGKIFKRSVYFAGDLDKIFKKPSPDSDGNGLRFQKNMCFRYQTTLPGCIELKYDISNPTWSQFIFGSANIRTVV
ncbi:uncharacterized protein LOC131685460 isoform X1 [Topomyia yanbarensis]|uniref:uncharacterized protein LOC131685460 isoform X1 n=1 Tax=Topomyia yanbarensis TaxID=2498891 RepID=UPI00273AC051|nr:uncharacterized protein LOC131685460 isoform X1 [Topomyia yanbarensis]XP_058825174.1 uncharacterized protein LOC131685460 isoform X1 [Topomyia yanbarensis]